MEKEHYYAVNFIIEGVTTNFKDVRGYKSDIRRKALYFRSHFQHLQIFKSDLLKVHYMHILKCDEIDFYETEAAFVIPMLEATKLGIVKIDEVLFEVLPRK